MPVHQVYNYVTGPEKIAIAMWAHDFCLLFTFFIVHNVLYYQAMAMQFSTLGQYLIGCMLEVTDC